jgi:hypothetical protein
MKKWVRVEFLRDNFNLKFKHMNGLSIIEGQILKKWEQRLLSIEQNQLAIMKLIQGISPPISQGNIPDFISITDASKKYHISKVTINNKIKLFEKTNSREIDRLQSGKYYLINEAELQIALRIKPVIKINFDK